MRHALDRGGDSSVVSAFMARVRGFNYLETPVVDVRQNFPTGRVELDDAPHPAYVRSRQGELGRL
jgi:hypothetical protein